MPGGFVFPVYCMCLYRNLRIYLALPTRLWLYSIDEMGMCTSELLDHRCVCVICSILFSTRNLQEHLLDGSTELEWMAPKLALLLTSLLPCRKKNHDVCESMLREVQK